jgi:GNAT superfamily N-acetyltransferase
MEEKIPFSGSDLDFSPITESDSISLSDFSCDVAELDDFFHDEILLCYKYHYLIPYKCTSATTGELLAVFTLANDVLALEYEDKINFPKLSPEYDNIFQRQPFYPAVNIGHLGVRKDLQSRGIGKLVVEFVAASFAEYQLSGCQFVTVDAINNNRTIRFYKDKIGFEFQTLSDMGKHTRRMYLDIFTQPTI